MALKDKLIKVCEVENCGGSFEAIGAVGHLHMTLQGPDGSVIQEMDVHNLITSSGKDDVLAQIGSLGSQPAAFVYSAIGSGTTAAASGDTLLTSELARVSGVYAHTGGTNNFTNTATFNPGVGTGTITEAGLFRTSGANASGILNHQTFGAVTKGALDTLTVQWTITLT